MTETICRPFITLRNGRVLYAPEVGKKAFCFPVKQTKEKATPVDKPRGEAVSFKKKI